MFYEYCYNLNNSIHIMKAKYFIANFLEPAVAGVLGLTILLP